MNYHHNYCVYQGQWIYYNGIPEILQIGEHQFAELKLVNMWIMIMLLSWMSATNCAHIYNMSFSGNSARPPASWQFNLALTSDQVYDAFTILSLLEDCQLQKVTLVVPHGGPANKCFMEAIHTQNNHFWITSQPVLFHYCNKCTHFYKGVWFIHQTNFTILKTLIYLGKIMNVVVIDSITNGHPCCRVSNCKIPLWNNHDHFCLTHSHMRGVCSIIGCSLPVASEARKTSLLPEHEAVENVHINHGQAHFQLK